MAGEPAFGGARGDQGSNAKEKPITKARKLESTKKPNRIFLSCFPPFVFSWWPLGIFLE